MTDKTSFRDLLNSRKSNHVFSKEGVDEVMWKKITDLINHWDSKSEFTNMTVRLHFHDNKLGASDFSGELGWVIGSYFSPNDKSREYLYQMEVAYRLFKLSIDLQRIGVASCFATYSMDEVKATELSKPFHSMEFSAPIALVIGIASTKGSIISKFKGWLTSDSYRVPLDQLLIEPEQSSKFVVGKVRDALTLATRAPSIGNMQTWRVLAKDGKIDFYAVSEVPEKFFNLGCFIAAYDIAAKGLKLKGSWKNSSHIDIEGDYGISFI
ncbi:hypothetical protein TVAG_494310 [Trichomonas vaginalis G3]|uniref:Putative nitroreductase TM1586 domain-containing protein n=1 Tax=Trichomonas vaginalis (strain ATCC PRA-98 / G3) TaxID=412133 RepID=A2DQ62_TRIV3|nr:putative TM nitroreductase family [Trichomonas vaginalis G3]EAY17489.1 hypothetical protein TVAG_494310 [Trichomonas vaginalis G3]KAI5533595.1 putative TM nitroreductase family [Trichomonas vaginalis G3]|eukprot:XP_001329624.1 hypothetical protein [Trichomonas vaginalis G3]